MARLILLVASGTLLLCQTPAAFATLDGDDDGTSSDFHDLAKIRPLTPVGKAIIEKEEQRFARNVNHEGSWNLPSYPSGGEAHQPAASYPAYDTYHQQVPSAQHQPQLGAYSDYHPSPAIQPQFGPYTAYQPFPAAQPQAEPYSVYQPSPAAQHQAELYPFPQPAPAIQLQAQSYPFYQPAPVVQPQAASYPVYQHAPVDQHQPVYEPAPAAVLPQPLSMVQTSPIGYPDHRSPCSAGSQCGYPQYPSPCSTGSQCGYPQITSPCSAGSQCGQPTVGVRYIPGVMIRRYQCRQKPECSWTSYTTPGRYVQFAQNPGRIHSNPTFPICPHQPCNPWQQPCNTPVPQLYPTAPPVNTLPPPYPTCAGHNQCGNSQLCCYASSNNNMGCYPGSAAYLRPQRHLQLNNTVTSRSRVELLIGDWRDLNVTSFVIDLLLPLKVDLEHDMEVFLRTDPAQNGSPCDTQDTDCIGQRVLSCVAEMWPSVIQPVAVAWSAPNNTLFPLIPPSGLMGEQPEAGPEEPLANTTNDLANRSEEDSLGFDDATFYGGEAQEVIEVDPVASAAHARQVRLLSFTACLLQSFGSRVVERKKSALLGAKRCVRAYKLEWPRVRACAAPRGQGVVREGRGQDLPHTRPLEITVNGEPTPDLINLKLALCQALLKAGQAPLLCDLVYNELDQSKGKQGLVNPEDGSTDNLSYEVQDSPSLRHTDSQGLGRGWNDQRLRFSHGLPRDQTQGGAEREQEFFRMQDAYGTQDINGALEAYGNKEAY